VSSATPMIAKATTRPVENGRRGASAGEPDGSPEVPARAESDESASAGVDVTCESDDGSGGILLGRFRPKGRSGIPFGICRGGSSESSTGALMGSSRLSRSSSAAAMDALTDCRRSSPGVSALLRRVADSPVGGALLGEAACGLMAAFDVWRGCMCLPRPPPRASKGNSASTAPETTLDGKA